jgi:hypothetical protein
LAPRFRKMRIRMTSFFPDLNVWLALSVAGHSHSEDAWTWANMLPRETRLIFCRYTHIGLLRLLTNQAVMGEQTLTLRKASPRRLVSRHEPVSPEVGQARGSNAFSAARSLCCSTS